MAQAIRDRDSRPVTMIRAVSSELDGPEAAELGLSEVISIIRRRKWVLAASVLPALLLAGLFVYLATPKYSAETSILIEDQEANIVSVESVVAGLTGDEETVRSEVFVLKSGTVAERVIRKLGLTEDDEFNPLLRDGARDTELVGPDTGLGAGIDSLDTRVLDEFLGGLKVIPQESSRVISLEYRSRDPRKAALIANTVVDEYIMSRLEAKYESTQRANTWLGERVGELREEVETAERAVEESRDRYGLLEGDGLTLATQELIELNTQLVMARTATAEARARLRDVQRLLNSSNGADTASEVLDSTLIQALREQEAEVERGVAELSSEFGDRHPRMVQLRAEAADLRGRIGSEVNKIVAGMRNQVNVAAAREATLQRSLDEMKALAAQANQNEIGLRTLEREAEANRSLLATLMARQKETISQEDLEFQQPDARIISRATVPIEPSFPNRPVVFGLALIASLFLGLLAILVLELLDSGFRSGEQIEKATGVASIGFIPRISNFGDYKTLPGYIAGKPNTAFGESIRTLNWSINLAFPDKPPQIVLITSSIPGEGKTTTASCLATLQSHVGKKTILIDADTRQPNCHVQTGIEREPGLVDVLCGKVHLHKAIHSNDWSPLSILPAGMATPNSPNLLGSSRMRELLETLRSEYELIIIDSPPVMAASDARILSQYADATVMVAKWASTRREVARHALKQLQQAGAKMAGTLLTLVDTRKHAQYSYADSGAYTGDLEKYYTG